MSFSPLYRSAKIDFVFDLQHRRPTTPSAMALAKTYLLQPVVSKWSLQVVVVAWIEQKHKGKRRLRECGRRRRTEAGNLQPLAMEKLLSKENVSFIEDNQLNKL